MELVRLVTVFIRPRLLKSLKGKLWNCQSPTCRSGNLNQDGCPFEQDTFPWILYICTFEKCQLLHFKAPTFALPCFAVISSYFSSWLRAFLGHDAAFCWPGLARTCQDRPGLARTYFNNQLPCSLFNGRIGSRQVKD